MWHIENNERNNVGNFLEWEKNKILKLFSDKN